MTDLGRGARRVYIRGGVDTLGAVAIWGEGVPGRVSRGVRHTLVRPLTAQPGTPKEYY
jgi:hypothetical protein